MPARDAAPIGAPCWVDLSTSDAAGARDFYSGLFGWSVEEAGPEHGGYANFALDGALIAGSMPAPEDAPAKDFWAVYVAAEDARETADAAVAAGAEVIVPAMDVMELGVMAVVADPGGAAIGIWQPGSHLGFGIVAETGAPSWFELYTRDYERVLDFYRDVFQWETRVIGDDDEFRYAVCELGEEQYAGVMDATRMLPEGVPSSWGVYFGSADTDASLERVVELGGQVLSPAEDTPYGRLAEAADPSGARFRLIQGNEPQPEG